MKIAIDRTIPPPVNFPELGEIVQIEPLYNLIYGGSLLIVTAVTENDITGYVRVPGSGASFLIIPHGKYERTGGRGVWIIQDE